MTLIELDAVGSTNDHAKELARQGAPAGTVVWAHAQTAGRGRQGNAWVSATGNLFMTLILRPQSAQLGQLSFIAAVALAETLEDFTGDVRVKWPNDVLVGGKKAAGILIETEGAGEWVVVGIGVNIVSAPEGAASLLGTGATARQVLDGVAARIASMVAAWETNGFSAIRDAWLARAWKLGEDIRARLPKETLTGVFDGIDATGALQLRMADGAVRTINSGEVYL